MPEFRITNNSFTSGVIGSQVDFRSDLSLYGSACRTLNNFLVLPQGPVRKRPGFKLINTTTYDNVVKIIPFQFSTVQVYLIAFENALLRVFKPGSPDTQVFSGASPYALGDLPTLRWTQSFDTLLLFHPKYPPYELIRNGSDTAWTLQPIAFTYLPYYRFPDTAGISLTPSGTSGTITITASAAMFTAGWVGTVIRFTAGRGEAVITAVGSSTSATATISAVIGTTDPDAIWEEAAWSPLRGYPVCASFHENRLIVGGTLSLPQTVFGSIIGLFFSFNDQQGTEIADDDSFEFTLASDQVNAAYDLYSVRGDLQVFTSAAEWVETLQPITPTSVSFNVQTRHGMSNSGVRICSVDSESLFVDRTGKQLRGLSYDFTTDSFTARNLTITSPDILVNPTQMVYLRSFDDTQSNYVLLRNSDSTVAVISIDSEQKVSGWFTFTSMAGFLDLAVIGDVLYALVSWNGHRHLVKLDQSAYLDLFVTATSGSAKTAWTGFTTFASQTVSVVGDSYVFNDIAVDASGNFTLPSAVSSVIVGLPYTATLETLPLSPAVNGQLMRGERIRKVKAEVTVRNTRDLWVDGRQISTRRLGLGLLDAPLVDEDITVEARLSGIAGEPTVVIESRNPQSCQINGLVTQISVRNP